MRHLKYIIPALVLTGCSAAGFGGNQGHHQSQQSHHGAYGAQGSHSSGQYAQPEQTCYATQCSPGSSYSVATSQAPTYGHDQGYAQNYAQAPDAHAYGAQTAQYGHQNQAQHSYGQPPQLRGSRGANLRRGYQYGSLGGILYDVDSDLYGIQGRAGYQSASFWGAELEGSLGVSDETETLGAVTETAKVNHQLAAFGVARLPLGEKLSVHSRVGYHVTKVTTELDDGVDFFESSASDSGLAYGAGVEYAFSPRNSVRMDYTRYDLDGGGADSVAVGIARKF